tara:strand:+ start:306 stop:698 length:393 start_codon:yes stop_codon:yes gene_type:complete
MENFIDCSKVKVQKFKNKGYSVLANQNIKKNDLIEKGIIQRIDYDGNKNTHLFTWSEDRKTWGFGSGCSTYYNTSLTPNVEMKRDFENDLFQIYALQDIKKNEELTHKYKSLKWRECFEDIRNILDMNLS